MNQLPPGFTIDPPAAGGLPPGFTVDPPPKREAQPFLERYAEGLMDPLYGLGQIAEKTGLPAHIRKGLAKQFPDIWSDSTMDDTIRTRDTAYAAPEGFDAARFTGNVLSPVNLLGARGAPGTTGAVQAVAQPTQADDDLATFALKKTGQAALGATLGRMVGGAPKTPEAKALEAQGVNVTRAQGAGSNIEEKLTSLPISGTIIEKARGRGAKEFQDAVLKREAGVVLPKGATVEEANKALSKLYEETVPHLKPTTEGWDKAMAALDAAKQNPLMTAENKKALDGIVNKYFGDYPSLDGRGLQHIQSELSHIARSFSGHTASPSDKVLAEEVRNVLLGLREGLEVGLPPGIAEKFARANKGWARMQPVTSAASARADELVTPRALQKAMARHARTETARLPADKLVDPALKVIERTIPDSGTAGRQAAQGLWPLVKGAAAAPFVKGYYTTEDILRGVPKAVAKIPRIGGAAAPYSRDALARALVAAQRGYDDNPED